MPGVLILEALAQTGGLLAAAGMGDLADKLFLFTGLDGVKFRRQVVPGDRLDLECSNMRMKLKLCKMEARAFVDGKLAAEARITGRHRRQTGSLRCAWPLSTTGLSAWLAASGCWKRSAACTRKPTSSPMCWTAGPFPRTLPGTILKQRSSTVCPAAGSSTSVTFRSCLWHWSSLTSRAMIWSFPASPARPRA